jgi:hypothetical protein
VAHPLIEELRKATRAQSARRPVDPAGAPESDRGPGGKRSPFGWLPMLVVAVLVVAGWFLIRQFQADAKLQDCVMSGRKNCAPLDVPPEPAPSRP